MTGILDRLRHRRVQRRLAAPRLLRAFADANPQASFVEIGANDGEQHDPLRPLIAEHEWSGIMVEPVPYVFERLRRNHSGTQRVILEHAAIADADGTRPFHHLAQADPGEADRLPDWYDGIGSFSREAVLSHAPQIPDIERRLVTVDVPCLTLASLLARHGVSRIDLLLIDAEGYDDEILRSIDFGVHRPRLVVYEHFHLDPARREAARALMRDAGYDTMEEGFDTFCLRLDGADERLAEAWRRLEPGVPGVSKHDESESPPSALYDDSVPLPPGAEEVLRGDNPRLAELRATYAALEVPATASSRWAAEHVDSFLDLRWFRGETLITWHYREEPGATARKYLAYLEYVRRRDELGLLDRLDEDGLFGCWTFDFADRGSVSRDLLQSVNELGFLERELGLSGRERISVLDVGAGYGRLAHRACTALPNLADYCCVDAIPESTFLSEYYLRFRGCSPPARVVALDAQGTELSPGSFDLAVNVHSWSECTYAAVQWWVARLAELEVPRLLVVPNEPDELLTLEADHSRRDFAPLLERAGYRLAKREPVIDDPAAAERIGLHDRFHLFTRD